MAGARDAGKTGARERDARSWGRRLTSAMSSSRQTMPPMTKPAMRPSCEVSWCDPDGPPAGFRCGTAVLGDEAGFFTPAGRARSQHAATKGWGQRGQRVSQRGQRGCGIRGGERRVTESDRVIHLANEMKLGHNQSEISL